MNIKLSKEQQDFIPWFLSNRSRCLKLIGYAGTGKTTVLKELKKVLPDKKTIWCAQTHTAKQVLNDKLGECTNIGTIASVLGLTPKIINGKKKFVPKYKEMLHTTTVASVEDTAKVLDIDLTDETFWISALETAKSRIEEFIELSK